MKINQIIAEGPVDAIKATAKGVKSAASDFVSGVKWGLAKGGIGSEPSKKPSKKETPTQVTVPSPVMKNIETTHLKKGLEKVIAGEDLMDHESKQIKQLLQNLKKY